MKSGKDEEKNMGPLFPRLHVNDTEKGGPRAPPRNKMALYEQLSVPAQRFNSGSSSTLPLPHSTTVSSASASMNQGGGHERTVFSPYYVPPPGPHHQADELHSRSSDGMNFRTMTPDFEQKSMSTANHRNSNATGRPSSTAECSSFHNRYFPNSKNSNLHKQGDEDDFRVPTFGQQGTSSSISKQQRCVEREIPTSFSPVNNTSRVVSGTCTSPSQPLKARDKHLKHPNTTDLRSRQHSRNQDEEIFVESVTNKNCAGQSTSRPSTGDMMAQPKNHLYVSDLRTRNSLVNDLERLEDVNEQLHEDLSDDVEEVNVSRVRAEPCSRASVGNGGKAPDKCGEDKTHSISQVEYVDRNDDVSETSILDSVSSMGISTDDVVGVIGQKHFWKARNEMANQQRVFSVQVFELHRLIKVQRLFAGSPHLLLENNPCLSKPSFKGSPAKKLPPKYIVKSKPDVIKQNDDSSKPNRSTECIAENAVEKPNLSLISNGIDRRNVNQHPIYSPYSEKPSSVPPPAANSKPDWCFSPPGNQWLVPIMSPSEGLVYKPYSGPCPPAAGFMAPFYGGCGSMSLPPMAGDYLNPAYRFPVPHQQPLGHHAATPNYFPPYGMPFMNSVISASAVEQVGPSTEQLSARELNVNIHSRNSCNMSKNQKSEAAMKRRLSKFRTSKERELHGSTASSPAEREQGIVAAGNVSEQMDALPLFPTAPATQDLDGVPQISNSDKQFTRVIKVVPHNPRSANESAARIFRSIQEERLQFDST